MTEPRGPIGWANQQKTEREQQPARKFLDQMSDRELVKLYERAEKAERVARSAARETTKALDDYLAAEQRAEQAEAANARVRKLADELEVTKAYGGLADGYELAAHRIREALAEPKEPRT